MKTIPMDLKLTVRVSPGDTYERSKILLARAHFNGTLELLTASWEKVLGYARHELERKTLRELMESSKAAAARAVMAILDERHMDPVDLTMRGRDGKVRSLRLHRRLDAYNSKIFILAEETRAAAVRAGGQTACQLGANLEAFATGTRK